MKKRVKNIARIIAALSLALTTTGISVGQVVFRSIEDAWKYADNHNIAVRTAKHEVDRARYATKQSYGALLPQVNATGSYVDNLELQTTLIPGEIIGKPGQFVPLQFGQQFAYSAGLAAQMNVINLQNWYNARIAKYTEEVNKDSLASTRKNVYQQIATQYYSFLLMQEAYKLAVQSADIADSVFQSVNNKFREGTVSEANVDVSKLNMERSQQNAVNALYQMLIAKNNMKALLGLSKDDSLSLESTLQSNLTTDVNSAFTEDPSTRIASSRTQLSLAQYRQTNSAFSPTINILYNATDERFDNKFEPFSGAHNSAAWFPAHYWSLQASLPIFSGGSRLYASKRAKIAYDESIEMYDYAKKQSAINDENIRLSYQKAAAVLIKAKDVMDLSFDNYLHISYRYQDGIGSIEDRLTAFKDYIDYQNQYLNSLSDMLVQLYQVKIRQQSL